MMSPIGRLRPYDIYKVYWDLVGDNKFKTNANQDRA